MRIRGKTDECLADVIVSNGRIAGVAPADDARACDLGGPDVYLSPGLLDIQINGYGGVDFNDPDTTPKQLASIVPKLWPTGVTAFCPTVITGAHEQINKCIGNLMCAADQSPRFNRALLGLHIEGPFISPEDGPRGAHPKVHTRPPDWDEFERWQDAARGRIRILTLAPEWPGALAFIERAADAGVIIAIGHTAARPAQIADAITAGARLSTHLGNGAHAKIDRHPNYIWEQLAADELSASLIVDGHHLPPSVVKSFLRVKGIARTILVTDAIAAAGCAPGTYKLGEAEVELTATGRVCLPGTPYLAGSALAMHEAVSNTVAFSDATFEDALRMASLNPARLLGIADARGTLAAGCAADVVVWRWDGKNATVVAVVSAGEIVLRASRPPSPIAPPNGQPFGAREP